MPAKVFDAYGRYYDLLYRDKDYVAEAEYISGLLKRHGAACREILEFGSGTGMHGRLLAERGYRVTGIELSPEMVVRAAPSAGFDCRQGDIRTVQLGRRFDAVLALFHVISYQVSNADVQAVFARAAEHLAPGGLLVFDVWYSPAVYAQKPAVRVKRLEEGGLQITRIAEPVMRSSENCVDVNYTIHVHDSTDSRYYTLAETHPMRHFSLPELDLLADAAGFQRVVAEAFLSGAEPSEDSWGVCLIMRRT